MFNLNLTYFNLVGQGLYPIRPNLANFKEVRVNEGESRRVLESSHRLGHIGRVMAYFSIKGDIMTKEKDVLVKEGKATSLWKTPSYSDNVLVGWGEVTLFNPTEAGLRAFQASVTLDNLMDVNRQKKTDVKNTVRRGTSAIAKLRKIAKVNPKAAQAIDVLVAKAEAGELTDDFLKSIGV